LSYEFNRTGLHTYGEYDELDGCGTIFSKNGDDPNHDPEFEIYLGERKKEIKRIHLDILRNCTDLVIHHLNLVCIASFTVQVIFFKDQ